MIVCMILYFVLVLITCLAVQVGQVSTPTANVTQALQKTTDTQKLDDVAAVLLEESRQAESSGQQMPLTIIFVERKARCDDVAELLRTEGLSALALHGGLSQWEREGALRDFTKGDVRVSSRVSATLQSALLIGVDRFCIFWLRVANGGCTMHASRLLACSGLVTQWHCQAEALACIPYCKHSFLHEHRTSYVASCSVRSFVAQLLCIACRYWWQLMWPVEGWT